jgi:hypothetical protein
VKHASGSLTQLATDPTSEGNLGVLDEVVAVSALDDGINP